MIENAFHASIILIIHREAVFLRRTLLSLDEAVHHAGAQGLTLELVAVLDRTDDATRKVLSDFDLGSFHGVQVVEVDHGSAGLSRNEGIALAQGEYVFTADADDLVSYNYFYDIHSAAKELGPQALYFPEWLMGFGDDRFICRYSGLDEVTPLTFVDKHPYISRLCAHRDVFRRIRYRDVKPSRGYAHEDWHFNAEAVGSGLTIHTVKDAILFYRQRSGSLMRSADALSIRQIPPSRLFTPSTYLKISAPYRRRFLEDAAPCGEAASEADFLADDGVRSKIQRANAIEPGICLTNYQGVPVVGNCMGVPPLGKAYHTICELVENKTFSDVFLFPFLSRGGAEKYFLSLMEVMYRLDPFSEFLVLLGEEFNGVQWTNQLPPNVTIVDMALHCRSLSNDQRCLLALKITETCGPDTRIHLRQSAFADRFLALYGFVLQERETIYYRFADIERIENGHATIVHSQLPLISENLDHLSKIVCDSVTTIRKDQHRIGTQVHKWQHLPAPVEAPAVLPPRMAGAERRILWAARLDTEKRPSLLPLISARLGRRVPDASIEVFGGSVFRGFDRATLEGVPSLRYCGSYDGFDTLPLSRYSIFLYTSLHDGIPNSLLEAMSYGLAVIAPDVGGISEVVIDGETGILLPSLADERKMAAAYAEALQTLLADPDVSAELGRNARAYVRRAHAPESHARRVAELFRLRQREFEHA